MMVGRARGVEHIWICEHCWVPIGTCVGDEALSAGWHRMAVYDGVRGGCHPVSVIGET